MKKIIPLLAFMAFTLVAGDTAHGQVLYGTTFDGTTTSPYNDSNPYTQGSDLVTQGGWTGNDDPSTQEGTSTTYHGGLNSVVAGSFGPGNPPTASGNAGNLDGEIIPADPNSGGFTNYPGQTKVFVAHPFTLTQAALTNGYALNTDFNVSAPLTTTVASGYGFAFLNASNANVVSVNFVKDTTSSGQDDVEYQVGTGSLVNTGNGAIKLGANTHLTLSVNVAKNTFNIVIGGVSLFQNPVSLGAANSGASVTQAAALQFIAGTATADGNGGYMGAGDDQINFDNFSITVPEPSTYLMMGLGLLGLVGLMKFRRLA